MLARPGLPTFEYVRPDTTDKAVELLLEHGEKARPLMGGTDIFPRMRDGVIEAELLVDVKHIPGMRDIRRDDGALLLGAAVTMNEIANHPAVECRWSLLAEAAQALGTYQVRNRATIGGNLCNASPCADSSLAVLVLEGTVLAQGPEGRREIPISDFFRGPGQPALGPAEIVTGVRLPAPPRGAVGHHLKLSRSKLGDLSVVSVEVLGYPGGLDERGAAGQRSSVDGTHTGPYEYRIGLGSVAPTPIRALEAERLLGAEARPEEHFERAAQAAVAVAKPIDDVRASSVYRRAMVHNLTRRGLEIVWEQLRPD